MYLLASGISAFFVLTIVALALASRLRQVFYRDGVWARLWARGPWSEEPVSIRQGAPEPLRRWADFVAPDGVAVETVAEARFWASGGKLLATGSHLAVLAFPHGYLIRWRSWAGLVPRTGFALLNEERFSAREWAFGVASTPVAADEDGTGLISAAAFALSLLWAPAAFFKDDWRETTDGLEVAYPHMAGSPVLTLMLGSDGSPERLTVSLGTHLARSQLSLTMHDFVTVAGYRVPGRVEATGTGLAGRNLVILLEALRYSGAWTSRC